MLMWKTAHRFAIANVTMRQTEMSKMQTNIYFIAINQH